MSVGYQPFAYRVLGNIKHGHNHLTYEVENIIILKKHMSI